MEISKVVIHQIAKEQGVNYTELYETDNILKINENVQNLIEKLNEAFKKDEKVIRSEFLEERNDFQETIRTFVDDETEEAFLHFTKRSIRRINDLLTGSNLATGGYFVYADYKNNGLDYVGVFLVRDSEEIIFDKDEDGTFIVNKTVIINTKKLAMAARINKNKLQKNKSRYLHFTFKQADISDYFVSWIEVRLSEKNLEDTKTLVNLINNHVEMPIDPATQAVYEPEKLRNSVYDYIQSVGRVVKISELSSAFWDDKDYLATVIENNNIDINQEFRAVASILSRFKKYSISSGKIRVSFSRSDIDQGRIYSGEGNLLVIDNQVLKNKFQKLDE
ncbi:nucleoid-associated protein [Salinimicrobium sp. TH3]|uniref:nucleoid-associated protein n=1 Tax=Salinimicrobium sp. TH3 TaxID=2997342 RepID=UPI0022756849|nr:nucleoid-associated protein [Salinimicrobium sp. TH3]MCY2685871.1 nucleoid-associated protein [Salinimicrobium sp. TH3]